MTGDHQDNQDKERRQPIDVSTQFQEYWRRPELEENSVTFFPFPPVFVLDSLAVMSVGAHDGAEVADDIDGPHAGLVPGTGDGDGELPSDGPPRDGPVAANPSLAKIAQLGVLGSDAPSPISPTCPTCPTCPPAGDLYI